jgi:hypothetical protein
MPVSMVHARVARDKAGAAQATNDAPLKSATEWVTRRLGAVSKADLERSNSSPATAQRPETASAPNRLSSSEKK